MTKKIRHNLAQSCPYCTAGPHYYCGHVQAAAPQQEVQGAVRTSGAGRFTKKPVTVEAIQWTGKNLRDVIDFTNGPPDRRGHHANMAWETYTDLVASEGLKIYTLEGKMLASPGDWIIRGVKGEYYPCKPEIFEATYSMAAPQQEAQEPSHRETVDVVGVRSNGEHVNLEKIAMPPRMKAREIAIEQFGSFKDDDGSDAEMCFGALEYFLEWLIQQGWSKAPQPAPAPASESIDQLERKLEIIGVVGVVDGHDVVRRESVLEIARRAALAAQGGK